MKVGTDAMLLGAWIAKRVESERAKSEGKERVESENKKSESFRILDIGTGTGVLALMLAQSSKALIDAVEIDKNAYLQAEENFDNSSWKNRINIFHSSIQDFKTSESALYDLIISNPPYFGHNNKALKESSKYKERSLARSSETLSFEDLLVHSKRLLNENGYFYVIIPFESFLLFISLAEREEMYLIDRLDVKSKKDQAPVRSILELSKIKKEISAAELVIYNQDRTYTEDYIRLTENYYAKNMSRSRLLSDFRIS